MRPLPPRLHYFLATLLVCATLGVVTLSTAAASPVATAEKAEDPGKLVLVLDSSGSMKNRTTGGVTRIEAAKDALRQVVEQTPDDVQVGMRVFGATVEFRDQSGACADTQNVVPVSPVDRDALTAAVEDYRPFGETPIGNALKAAAKDLGPPRDGERRTIVLLSDGEATCAPDPCRVAADLSRKGIDLAINVVGLNVSGKARRALQCIARAGNGQYYDASNADELANSMIKVSVRDLRGFRLVGERIEGGLSPDQALPVEPGTYVDTSPTDENPRYYLVDVPEGGGVAASVLTRPPRADENFHTAADIVVLTPAGVECVQSHDRSFQVVGQNRITSTGVAMNQFSNPLGSDEVCLTAEQLLVAVHTRADLIDYRIQITAHPRIANAEELPAPIDQRDESWLAKVTIPAQSVREPVVGGVTFDDAPELTPGTTYADTLRPSEQLVYKVRAGYGQAVRIGARLDTDSQAAALLGRQRTSVALNSYTSLGQRLDRAFDRDEDIDGGGFYDGKRPRFLTGAIPPVRVRNVELSSSAGGAPAYDGYQYFTLGMGRSPAEEQNQFAAPVSLRVELVGEVSGAPQYDGEIAGPAASAGNATDDPGAGDADDETRASDSGSTSLPWILGGLGAAVLLVLVLWLGRRSRT